MVYAARLAYVVAVILGPGRDDPRAHRPCESEPGKINYGSAGPGTPQNIACELFKMMAGGNLVHIPYRGGAPERHWWAATSR